MIAFNRLGTWKEFYDRILNGIPDPNDKGWANVKCTLPTHPKADGGKHGSINVYTGNYRCWSDRCRQDYNGQLGKKSTSLVITPREVLILLGIDEKAALRSAVEYSRTVTKEDVELFEKSYMGELPGARDFVEKAQALINPDLEIVVEYCKSRGISYETLKSFGAGYINESDEQDECIVLPYYLDGKVVGIRGRTIDGRKGATKNSWLTLFNMQILDTKPSALAAVIVEGETDCLLLSQILKDNDLDIPVFGTPGVRFESEWYRHLQGYELIYYIQQADRASAALLQDIRLSVPKSKLRLPRLPWRVKQWGKDLADFVAQNDESILIQTIALPTPGTYTRAPRLVTAGQLIEMSKKEPEWVIPGLIERGTKTLLVGPPKAYKTWVALQLMWSVVSCKPFMGVGEWTPRTVGMKTLLIEEEGSVHRIAERVSCIVGTSIDDPGTDRMIVMHRQGVRLDDPDSLELLKEDVRIISPDILLIDPFQDIHNQDENSVQGTKLVLNNVDSILWQKPEVAVVILHHTPKQGSGARGSSALFASVDTLIEVQQRGASSDGFPIMGLKIQGRDLPAGYGEGMVFEFVPSEGRHIVSHDAGEKSTIEVGKVNYERIADFIAKAGEPVAAATVTGVLGISLSSCKAHLTKMVDTGVVRKIGTGKRGSPVMYELNLEEEKKDGKTSGD